MIVNLDPTQYPMEESAPALPDDLTRAVVYVEENCPPTVAAALIPLALTAPDSLRHVYRIMLISDVLLSCCWIDTDSIVEAVNERLKGN